MYLYRYVSYNFITFFLDTFFGGLAFGRSVALLDYLMAGCNVGSYFRQVRMENVCVLGEDVVVQVCTYLTEFLFQEASWLLNFLTKILEPILRFTTPAL
jgi:hypothetical protein